MIGELLWKLRIKIGGGFASALAVAFRRADPGNRRRLREAFPDLISRYAEMAKEAA